MQFSERYLLLLLLFLSYDIYIINHNYFLLSFFSSTYSFSLLRYRWNFDCRWTFSIRIHRSAPYTSFQTE